MQAVPDATHIQQGGCHSLFGSLIRIRFWRLDLV